MLNHDLTKIRGLAFDVDGVLSPSTVPVGHDGIPVRMGNIKDGYALQLASRLGYHIAIITGANVESIRTRYEYLGIKDVYLGAACKIDIFNSWMERNELCPEEVLFMGDDIPDLQCMERAGLACCPNDACIEARETAHYVSRFNGGAGCVRDVIEKVLRAQGKWLSADAHIW